MISWAKSFELESLGPENTEAVSFDLSEDIDISFDLLGIMMGILRLYLLTSVGFMYILWPFMDNAGNGEAVSYDL
jgi:hypothetical protein